MDSNSGRTVQVANHGPGGGNMAALVGGQGSDDSLKVALMADHGSSGIETIQVGSRGPGGGDVAIPAADHISAPMSNGEAQ